eukprot:435987-Rhodomonas_salina.1
MRVGMLAKEESRWRGPSRGATSSKPVLAQAFVDYDGDSCEVRVATLKKLSGVRIEFRTVNEMCPPGHNFVRSTSDPEQRVYPDAAGMIEGLGFGRTAKFAVFSLVDETGAVANVAFAGNPKLPGIFAEIAAPWSPEIPIVVPQDIMAHLVEFPAWGDPLIMETEMKEETIKEFLKKREDPMEVEREMTGIDAVNESGEKGGEKTIFWRVTVASKNGGSTTGLEK